MAAHLQKIRVLARKVAIALGCLVAVAVGGMTLTVGCGGSNDEEGGRPKRPTASPTAGPTSAPEARREMRKRRTSAAKNRTSQKAGAQRRPRRTPRRGVPSAHRPKKGEAVVPNKPHCTGPDVFDQPGCETIPAP